MGDQCSCCGAVDIIVQGEPTVFVNGRPVVTVGCRTAHGGVITQGSPNVNIGNRAAGPLASVPQNKLPAVAYDEPTTLQKIGSYVGIAYEGPNAAARAARAEVVQQAPDETPAEDSTTVTLKTSYARDQLFVLARHWSEPYLLTLFIEVFCANNRYGQGLQDLKKHIRDAETFTQRYRQSIEALRENWESRYSRPADCDNFDCSRPR